MHSTDSTEALQSQGNFQTCLDAKEQAFGEACDGLAIGFDVWKGRDGYPKMLESFGTRRSATMTRALQCSRGIKTQRLEAVDGVLMDFDGCSPV